MIERHLQGGKTKKSTEKRQPEYSSEDSSATRLGLAQYHSWSLEQVGPWLSHPQ